jgi:imidazolonepropionase-like amidohydrolase
MTRLFSRGLLTALLILGVAHAAAAQDVTITNARIVVGNGQVIERGSVVVRGGRITSVASGAPAAPAGQTIDAAGLTAIAGFIDGHRHVNAGPNEKAQMQALLEAGYTTILSGGGSADGNMMLRDHIEKGMINGPRIIPSGSVRLSLSPDEARAEVRRIAGLGIRNTGEISLTPKPGPTARELEVLRAILDEGSKAGVTVHVHAVSPQTMMAAVDAGVRRLVHTPHSNSCPPSALVCRCLACLPTTTRHGSATARRGRNRSSTATAVARRPDTKR